jgi:organic radical activating enzyme
MDEHNKERNALNLAHAIALSHKHGYHLSVQLHKVLGIE